MFLIFYILRNRFFQCRATYIETNQSADHVCITYLLILSKIERCQVKLKRKLCT